MLSTAGGRKPITPDEQLSASWVTCKAGTAAVEQGAVFPARRANPSVNRKTKTGAKQNPPVKTHER